MFYCMFFSTTEYDGKHDLDAAGLNPAIMVATSVQVKLRKHCYLSVYCMRDNIADTPE